MTAWFQWALRHRWLVLGVVAALTVLSLASLSRAVIASNVGKLFLGDSPEYARYLRLSEQFGGDELLLIGVQGPLPQGAAADRLRGVLDELRQHPDVGSVLSPLDLQRLRGEDGSLVIEPVLEVGSDPWAAARASPVGGGLVVSETHEAWAVVVAMRTDGERSAELYSGFVRDALSSFEAAGYDRDDLHVGGMVRTVAGIMDASLDEILFRLPTVALVLLFTVWLLFRRLTPALLALGVSGIAVAWMMGIAIQIDRDVNILMAFAPAVVLIVGFSDVVHLVSAYLIELEHGRSKREAILASAEDVGRACLFTSATTFVGFVSLSFIPTPAFRQLGVVLGAGVATALLLAVTLVPVVLDLLPEPPALRHGASGRVQVAIDGALAVCERIAIGSPRTVAAVFVATTALSLVGAWGLHIETDFRARLSPDNPVRVDGDWFDERFAGANVLPLYLDVGAGGALDPGVLTAVAALQAELVAMPEIDAAFSLADVLSEVHGALRGAAGEQESSLPATRAAAAQELLLFEMSGGDGVERVVDGERGRLPVVLRLDAEAFRHTAAVGRAVEAAAARHLPGAEAVATSLGALIGGWLDSIVTGQRNGLGFSVLVIALMMAGGLRSLRVGIASMLPNLLPLLVIAGWIGFTWVAADSDTFVVLLLAIGIGVDDTIHFLVRYRVERQRVGQEEALRRTFAFAGRAIVMTTVILVCGFAPLAGSDYFTIRMLGTLLPAALVVALLADVLLVPAMVRLGWIRWD